MKEFKDIPHSHRQIRGAFEGVTPSGVRFSILCRMGKRRANSGEMMRAHIRQMTRGMPMAATPYVDQEVLELIFEGHHRRPIEIMPGGYRAGCRSERSLRDLVGKVAQELKLDQSNEVRRQSPAP